MANKQVNIEGVNFQPWVGENYFKPNRFGLKLLLIGESHFGGPENNCPEVTVDVVRRYTEKDSYAYFTKISKFLVNRDSSVGITFKEMQAIWGDIAFYNYIQSLVGDSARVRPTRQQWSDSKQPLKAVLKHLKPDLAVLLGLELSSNLHPWEFSSLTLTTMHPSTAFSYDDWNPKLQEAITFARKDKSNA